MRSKLFTSLDFGILEFYGTLYESFQQACETMMSEFKGCIPEGSLQARIRATKRETTTPERAGEDIIGSTLADEAIGMCIIDPSGHPMKYDDLTVLENVVASQHVRIELDVPGPGGKGWRRTNSSVLTSDLGEHVCEDIAKGSAHILEHTYVAGSDPHYDAKTWPVSHPYGSGTVDGQKTHDCERNACIIWGQMLTYINAGFSRISVVTWSVYAEPGSGGIQRHARNRLTQIQPWFRRSPMWAFWSLNRLLYSTLFFKNLVRRKAGIKTASSANDPDAFTRHFGTAQPSSIPECTSATNTLCACVATRRFFFK